MALLHRYSRRRKFRLFQTIPASNATNWFPGSAGSDWEPIEMQALPAIETIEPGMQDERRSLEDSAFPGRAWERAFERWRSPRSDLLLTIPAKVAFDFLNSSPSFLQQPERWFSRETHSVNRRFQAVSAPAVRYCTDQPFFNTARHNVTKNSASSVSTRIFDTVSAED